jgi:hypothetical protein
MENKMRKHGNPKYQQSGSPELMAMQCNAVNLKGEHCGAICRDRAGNLGGLTADHRMYGIPENELSNWLWSMELKYRKVV